MRALVTGDRGFLGRHFRTALESQGVEVFGLDSRNLFSDCRDLFLRPETHHLGSLQFDLVVHAAAVVGGRAKIDGDPLALAENLELDGALFRWAARVKPGRVVYLSSSAVYPTRYQLGPVVGVLKETDTRGYGLTRLAAPDRVYGWTKLVGEALATEVRALGVPVTVVRPFSGYGADQDLDYPFPSFIDRAKRRADPFKIWGDGKQVRDFVHVDDVVGATLAAVQQQVDGPLNICTGRGTSFNQLAKLVCEQAGYAPRFVRDLDAPQGVRYRVGDPTELRKIYEPKISLEEGLARALGC